MLRTVAGSHFAEALMAQQTQLLSSWHRTFEGMRQSTQEFYAAIETAIKERTIPDVKIARIEFKEGGMFSSKREYLHIKRGDLTMYLCGAPFGNGFFVSSRLIAEGSFLDGVLGEGLLKAIVKPDTFFKVDSTQMYLSLVHSAVVEVLDSLTTKQSLPTLTAEDRRPVMREFYQ